MLRFPVHAPALAALLLSACAAPPAQPPTVAVPTQPPVARVEGKRAAPAEDLVAIPAGSFLMGAEGMGNNTPEHEVKVAAFQLDRTEVTVGAYRACVDAGKCTPALNKGGGHCNFDDEGADRQPINCVDWNQAVAYCASRGARLPTEEEWEYAARGPDGGWFPWGGEEPKGGVCYSPKDAGRDVPCDVGTSPLDKSPFGVLDLAGNVQEWVAGPLCPYPENKCGEKNRVRRGGAFGYGDWNDLSVVERTSYPTDHRYDFLGFRCGR